MHSLYRAISKSLSIILLLSLSISVRGQHNHEAHTHGQAYMALVHDQGQLLIELKTPAANMLGFEHDPQSEPQWQLVERLSQILRQPKQLLELDPGCDIKKTEVDLPFERKTDEKKSTPDHGHDHHHDTHKDILIQYEGHCKEQSLSTVKLKYFDLYPQFESITVDWIVNGQQGSTQLTKKNPILNIRKK